MSMAKIFAFRRKSTLALRQRKSALLRLLAPPPPDALRASYVERVATCGKPNCRCTQGHKHGPFYFLTQCLAVGHIQKFLLKDPAQQAAAQHGIAAYYRFYDILEELSQLNAELLRRGEPLADPGA
jgi:hypothetical protein